MTANDLRQQRLEAYHAKKQAKLNKTIGKKPTNLKFKNGTINSIRTKYHLSPKAASEYNNMVKTKTPIDFRMALIKSIISAGNTRKENVIKMFFYAKDVEAYAHWIDTELAKVELAEDSVLGKELVNNMKAASFYNAADKVSKAVESYEIKQEGDFNDKLKTMLEELDELEALN